MMTTLPNRVSALFADPLQSVLHDFSHRFPWTNGAPQNEIKRIAPLSLWEDDRAVYLKLDLPGVRLEDIEVTVEKGLLRIRGNRQFESESPTYLHQERHFGQFERAVSLGEWMDPNSVQATLQDGVLSLTVPKAPEAQCQRIAVNYLDGKTTQRLDDDASGATPTPHTE